jgi:hypothetical protein
MNLIMTDGGKQCSLVTLVVPCLYWSQVDIYFMSNMQNQNSVSWRQILLTGNITCSTPLWVSVRHMIHEYYAQSRLGLLEPNRVHW